MPNTAPRGVPVTILMTVDSTARIGLFSGGTKVSEQAVGNSTPSIPLVVAALRFGATEPNGYKPGTFLFEQIYGWTAPLPESQALLVSSNLNYAPPVAEVPKPVVSIPASLTVQEGETLQVPITKEGVGACTVQLRTIGVSAFTPADYTGFQQVFSFGANDTVINVPLVTILNPEDEPDEKLKIELSLPTDCTLGNAIGEVTITEPPRISVPATASVKEGNVLTLIVTKVGNGACSVTWRTSADTATVASSDYLGINATTLNFSEAEAQKIVTVTTLTDALVEGSEFFNIFIENPSKCKVTNGICKVELLDANSPEVPVETAYTPPIGFGSPTLGGLGYPVFKVTNLNDSGAGSLREGVSSGNKMVVFEVAGRIVLQSHLSIGSNVTIAGATAPPPGITVSVKELIVTGKDVRISHVTFERGYDAADPLFWNNGDVAKIGTGGKTIPTTKISRGNYLFAHCAFYWGMDETIQHFPWNNSDLKNISWHECIFAEPLWKPRSYNSTLKNHDKVEDGTQTQHNYGMIIAFETRRIDVQHCLFADMDMREPFIDRATEVVLANNIANNCTKGATIQQNPEYDSAGNPINANLSDASVYKVTCKGYLCISGPNTGTAVYSGFRFNSYRIQQPKGSAVHVQSDALYGWKGGTSTSTWQTPGTKVTYGSTATGYDGVVGKPYWLDGATKVAVEVSTPPIDTTPATKALTAQEIYDRALVNIGPRPKEIRAVMEKKAGAIGNHNVVRTIQRLKDKTGGWVNHQDETHIGGYYKPSQVTRTFNSTAKFPDGTLIGEIPNQPQPSTATSRADMNAWLRKHLDRVQHD